MFFFCLVGLKPWIIGCEVGVVVGRGFVLHDWVLVKPSRRALSVQCMGCFLVYGKGSCEKWPNELWIIHGNGCSLSVVGRRPAKLQVFHRPMAGPSCQKAICGQRGSELTNKAKFIGRLR